MSHRHVRQIWMDRLSDRRDWVLSNGMKRILPRADYLERAKRAEYNGDCRVNVPVAFSRLYEQKERRVHAAPPRGCGSGEPLEGPVALKQEVSARRIFLRTDIHW